MSCCLGAIKNLIKGMCIMLPEFSDALVQRVFFVMQAYFTNGWRLSVTHAAAIMNFWEGSSLVLPTLLQFLADKYVGNLVVALITTISSAMGIGMVALSVPSILDHNGGRCLKPGNESCLSEAQKGVFCTGMVLTAVGRAGISFSLGALHEEQLRKEKCCSKAINCYLRFVSYTDKHVILLVGMLFTVIWTRKWKVLFGVPAIYSAITTFQFLCGSPVSDRAGPDEEGGPITSVVRLVYAALRNPSQPLTHDTHHDKTYGIFDPRFLDRALPSPSEGENGDIQIKREKVEVARFVVGMIPISCTFILCGIVSSIGNTYFSEQANHMNRRLGKWNAPLQVLLLPVLCFKHLNDFQMSRIFKKDHHREPIYWIASAMLYSVLCCIAAAITEMKRLKVVRSHDLLHKPDYEQVPMHAASLLFQFFFLAGLDSCLRKSFEEFYKSQAPQHLKHDLEDDNDNKTKRYLNTAVSLLSGLGYLSSVLSVYVVGKLSTIGGNDNWFQYTLNRSHLDRYYWLLAGWSGATLLWFIFVAWGYYPLKLSDAMKKFIPNWWR